MSNATDFVTGILAKDVKAAVVGKFIASAKGSGPRLSDDSVVLLERIQMMIGDLPDNTLITLTRGDYEFLFGEPATKEQGLTDAEKEELNNRCRDFFEAHEREHGHFGRIDEDRLLSGRRDVNALVLLDRLIPGDDSLLVGTEWDGVDLSVELYKLMQVASEEDLRDLIRCGVKFGCESTAYLYI